MRPVFFTSLTGRFVPGCIFPKAPENGRVRRLEYDASEDAEYRCYSGMALVGRPQYCSPNGTWLGRIPKCIGDALVLSSLFVANMQYFFVLMIEVHGCAGGLCTSE